MEDITRLITIGALGWIAKEWFLRIIKRNQYKKILEALTDHMNVINYGICKKFKINDNILRDTFMIEAQDIYMMIYAITHGQGDEMQGILDR